MPTRIPLVLTLALFLGCSSSPGSSDVKPNPGGDGDNGDGDTGDGDTGDGDTGDGDTGDGDTGDGDGDGQAGVCGDSKLTKDEACDDGNT